MRRSTRDKPAAPSLYKRLGGYDALAAVTDDFIGRLASDQQLAKFFAGHSKDSLGRIRQLVVDQLCAATGGPCVYIGRDMKSSHQGMGITEADWRLFPTLVRFDVAYFSLFKCNKKRIADYPNLLNYMRDLYQVPGVAATVTPRYYVINYWSIKKVNPTGIIPKGTPVDYTQPHDRARLAA